jgi:hypothetical protein
MKIILIRKGNLTEQKKREQSSLTSQSSIQVIVLRITPKSRVSTDSTTSARRRRVTFGELEAVPKSAGLLQVLRDRKESFNDKVYTHQKDILPGRTFHTA